MNAAHDLYALIITTACGFAFDDRRRRPSSRPPCCARPCPWRRSAMLRFLSARSTPARPGSGRRRRSGRTPRSCSTLMAVRCWHDRLGLVVVARAHVEDVAVHADCAGDSAPVKGPTKGTRASVKIGIDARCRGRADVAEEREHPVLVDELLRVLGRARRLVAVVERLQDDLAAVHAAARVDLVEVERARRAACRARAARAGPGEGDRLAEHDLRVGDALRDSQVCRGCEAGRAWKTSARSWSPSLVASG